jgi:hypothetical protein
LPEVLDPLVVVLHQQPLEVRMVPGDVHDEARDLGHPDHQARRVSPVAAQDVAVAGHVQWLQQTPLPDALGQRDDGRVILPDRPVDQVVLGRRLDGLDRKPFKIGFCLIRRFRCRHDAMISTNGCAPDPPGSSLLGL